MTTESAPSNANSDCVGPTSEKAGTASGCEGCPNKSACASGQFRSPEALAKAEQTSKELSHCLDCVQHVVLVLSGKGGVGKSTVASQLSHTLALEGYAVGLLDVDLCGPSVPRMAGSVGARISKNASGQMIPIYQHEGNLAVMSIQFLLQDPNAAVVWRGPRKNALLKQFLTQVDWRGDTDGLDYLIVDTPPGTSDEHIETVQLLEGRIGGAIMITTPEEVAMADVRKELNFCTKTKTKVLGLVENMARYDVPMKQLQFWNKEEDVTEQVLKTIQEKCPEILELVASSYVFPTSGDGVAGMATQYDVPLLGKIPLDPRLLKACEEGTAFVGKFNDAKAGQSLIALAEKLVKALPVAMDES